MALLTMGYQSPKLAKSDKSGKGYLSCIMYLAPSRVSGHQVCPQASPGCIAACLNTAGRGIYQKTQDARIRRTNFFFDSRDAFKRQLIEELKLFVKRCWNMQMKPACRLNGTSDLPWETLFPELFVKFPHVQFYDYTKIERRMIDFLCGKLPRNYHLTFSRSEINDEKCKRILSLGGNVAVVFRDKNFPVAWGGFPCYNADETDLRFLDPQGVGALYAKGKAKRDNSGFVIPC